MQYKKITDLALGNKVVLIRTDMNVPLEQGHISDDTRITAGLKTISYALNHGAQVIVATHLGRPTEGICNPEDSVTPIAIHLGNLLNLQIPVIKNLDSQIDFGNSNIVMLENVRCNIGEKANSDTLGQKYAALCDIFVHDAFATAHRAEASTDSIGEHAKTVCAGLVMSDELNALNHAFAKPKHPVLAIVGGSKVSSKLTILNNLAAKVDYLIVGGGILNTFLLASGYNIGKSLAEPDLIPDAQKVLETMTKRGCAILLPEDVVVAKELSVNALATSKQITALDPDDMILDVGNNFANKLATVIKSAATIIWNGPLGVFEFNQFANGTKIVASAIACSNAYSLAGGGDTIAAINKFGLSNDIDYISTAGGALLEFLEGKKLPAITLLESRAKN